MVLSHLAGFVSIGTNLDHSSPHDDRRVSVAADWNEILYGESVIEYGNVLYEASPDGISAVQGERSSLTAEKSSTVDNLNAVNGKLYSTVFENGVSSIRSMDIGSGNVKTLLDCGSDEILNMYVVNGSYILYLTGGSVYKLNLGSHKPEKISKIENVRSFIPSPAGNIYAVGSVVDSTIYVDEHFMIDHADYYSINGDNFIFSVDSNLFQVPMTSLAEFCTSKDTASIPEDETLFSIAEGFDMYGSVAVDELLDEEEVCEECAQVDSNEPFSGVEGENRVSLSTGEKNESVELLSATLDTRQQQIINRAAAVVNLTWTCLENFHRWYDADPASEPSFAYVKNRTYTGLPYSRPGRYDHHPNPGDFRQVYIGYFGFNGANSEPKSTLQDFSSRIIDPNDNFWERVRYRSSSGEEIYKYYGPLYGMDCSSFVSYAWNVTRRTTDGFDNKTDCKKLTNYATSYAITLSDLAILRPGDALVKSESHAILVTDVAFDSSGNVCRIEIMEETPPLAKHTVYGSKSEITNKLLPRLNKSGTKKYQFYRLSSSVTLNPNLGTCTTSSIIAVYGKSYGEYCQNNVLPAPTRTGYSFVGWYTSKSGGSVVTANTIVTEFANHTIYARWSPNQYLVLFNANGGTTNTSSKMVTFGSKYGTLPTPTRSGYTFTGWKTKLTGGTTVTSSTTVTTALKHTLYASWIPETVAPNVILNNSSYKNIMEVKPL